jgi:predicted peptidase
MSYKEIENRTRYDALFESKKEMERMNEDKISQMIQAHQIELERRRQDYQDKMDADSERFKELKTQEEEKQFQERLNEMFLMHKKALDEL